MCFLDKLYRNIWLKIFCAMNIIVPYILMTSTFVRIFAGSLEAAYPLNWGAREIWGKGGGETLALL